MLVGNVLPVSIGMWHFLIRGFDREQGKGGFAENNCVRVYLLGFCVFERETR